MAPFQPNQLLDLTVTSRAEGYRFDLLDRDLNRAGTLSVDRGKAPKIDHNANRSIKRTLQGLSLSPREALAIDPITDRVQPVMVLSDGTEWPLGVFLFSDWSKARTTAGLVPDGSFVDQGIMLDQPCPRNVSVAPGSNIAAVIRGFLAECRITDSVVVDTGARVSPSTPSAYKAGVSWLSIITDLTGKAGLYSPAFDHRGRCQVVAPAPADDTAQADVTYDAGGRIYDGTIVESDNSIEAPNRYIVIDTAANDSPIVGVYDVPAAAPWSIAARGYVVSTTIEAQGVGSVAAAVERGRRAYLTSTTVETVTFATPPDPRHDLWNTVAYRAGIYREQTWAIACKEGAAMTHSIRRYYS